MPGLVAILKKKEKGLDTESLLAQMCQIIKHESWYKTYTFSDKSISMGRVSLGILNPEPQPIFNEDKSMCIIMEGEIYDSQNLKEELISKGHNFSVNNDPEFVLHLYKEYEKEFGEKLKELNGTFLFVIYDINNQKFIICNDRYGFRPLYWCDRGNYLLFASEIKAILQDRNFKRKVNLEAMADFFSFGYVLGDKTLVDEIKLLPPASIFIHFKGKTEINQYWNWNQIKKTDITNENEIVDELGRLWLQAVERRMHSRTRIGITLSGGLDSRAIASAISRKYYPIHAVTFGRKGCEDYTIAKRVCDKLGFKHHFVEITGEKWLSGIEKTVYITDGHLNVIHQHTWNAVDVVKKYMDVNLNGFLGATVKGAYLTQSIMDTKNIEQYCDVMFTQMNQNNISPLDEDEFYSQNLALIKGRSKESLARNIKKTIKDSQNSDYFVITHNSRRFVLMGMICSQTMLENHKPFFDKNFIEFVYSLPPKLRFKSYIFNKMLLKFFPDTFKHIPYQKTGLPIGANKIIRIIHYFHVAGKSKVNKLFQRIGLPISFKDNRNYADYNNWMRYNTELREYIYDTVLSERALDRDYFNPAYIKKLIDEHMSGKKNYAQIIGLLLTFELFNRMFIDGDRL